jgi:hypothetical protein
MKYGMFNYKTNFNYTWMYMCSQEVFFFCFLFSFTMRDFIFLFSNSKGLCKQLGIRVPCEELLGPFAPLRLKVPKE